VLAGASDWDLQTQATLQHDVSHFSVGAQDGDENAARRSRVSLKATSDAGVALKLEWDFASGTATDLYVDWSLAGSRNLKLGQFKQPFSLEELGSSRDLLLLERSLAHDAFTIGRRVGVMWSQPVGRLNLESSAFFGVTEQISGTQGVAMRLYAADQPNRHLGVAVAVEQRDDERLRQRARSESRLLPLNPLDTGSRSDVGNAVRIGLEGALIKGSWTLQSELFGLRGQGDDRPTGVGATAQVSWASHGAARSIKNGAVKKPDVAAQPMLWELAARASHVEFDINDGSLASQTQFGIGASLYLGTRWKLMAEQSYFDASRSNRLPRPGDVTGHFSSFRLQLAL
jgi:phosphate-selective porin OprO/OprP